MFGPPDGAPILHGMGEGLAFWSCNASGGIPPHPAQRLWLPHSQVTFEAIQALHVLAG